MLELRLMHETTQFFAISVERWLEFFEHGRVLRFRFTILQFEVTIDFPSLFSLSFPLFNELPHHQI